MTVLQNNTKGMLIHKGIKFAAGAIQDIPADIAEIWLKINGVVEYVDPEKNKVKEAQSQAKIEKLEAENKELKEKVKELEAIVKAGEKAPAKAPKTAKKK